MINFFKCFFLLFIISGTVFFTSCETLNNNSDAEDEFLNDSGQTFSADKKENVQNKKVVSGKKQLTEQERKAMKEADMWLPDDTK